MDSKVKTRHSSSVPSSLGKQIGVLPIGTSNSARNIGKSEKTVPVGGTDIVEGRQRADNETRQWTGSSQRTSPSSRSSQQTSPSSRSSQLSSYSSRLLKDDRTNTEMLDMSKRSPSDRRMTKSSFSSRGSSVASEPPSSQTVTPSGIETNLINPDSTRTASSSKAATSKPPSSRTRSTKTSNASQVSKHLASPSNTSLKGAKEHSSYNKTENKNEIVGPNTKNSAEIHSKKSPGLRTGSSRTSSTQSRTLKSSQRSGSNGSINTLTSHANNDNVISDSESGDEQEVKFFNVQSQSMQSSRASSKLSSRSKRGSGSATQRKQDCGKKPYKTIDPEEILAQNMESDFNKIYEINQHACELTSIENLEKFRKLKVLDLSCNFIDQIQNLEYNRELKELKFYDNRLRKIENLDSLRDLGSLQLQHNKIKTIGKGLSQLKKLQNLRLDCNQLLKIDTPELSSCVQLKVLDISSNMLDNLAALNYLPNLEELNASGNRIRSVSDLSKCKQLQEVDLSRNRITDLSGLKGLPRLLTLNVSFNAIVSLKSIGKLRQLQDLFATNNRIHDLSCLPNVVPKLEVLDLSENEISDWDEMYVLEEMPELVELFLSGNPFCDPDGPMPHYYTAITAIVPELQIIDGAHIKKHVSKGVPLMRPMSASSIVSLRQMGSQMKTADEQMESLEKSLEEKFAALRATCDSLPAEPPRYHDFSLLNRPDSGNSSVAGSRCSTRSRLRDAQAYAASTDFD